MKHFVHLHDGMYTILPIDPEEATPKDLLQIATDYLLQFDYSPRAIEKDLVRFYVIERGESIIDQPLPQRFYIPRREYRRRI